MQPDDERGFEDFVTARRADLVRTAFLLCGDPDEAHDLVQVALMRVHRRWRSITRTDAPEVYARKIVVNLTASWWRRKLRMRWVPLSEVVDAAGEHPAQRHDQRDELWRAVMTLPPRTRAVLVLRYFEDLTEAETARQLGCSIGSVKSQASRGLDRLRHVMRPETADLSMPMTAEVQA